MFLCVILKTKMNTIALVFVLVLKTTADEITRNLGSQSILGHIGSPVTSHEYRSSLAIIAQKQQDGSYCPYARDYAAAGAGPVQIG